MRHYLANSFPGFFYTKINMHMLAHGALYLPSLESTVRRWLGMEIEYQYIRPCLSRSFTSSPNYPDLPKALYMGPSGLSSHRTGRQQYSWNQHTPSFGKRATPANNKFNNGGRL
ncbi:hypothetical protein MGG_17088 [Pyricularia oryzae 70-15]|uniref:Uncharacterized protein n=1 Tax=Pyricularia oryzae (strain 70-15 / ATCC MYA-4617 / FGSC 8958) TaxID=242507 RepID=G4N8A8_PYRO7|nr:uncharacterized protein MGG_17088 [Pyricularia oryzae 70-15]EHA50155.1 hypothetical protein MGG_17088 [Pyricularia oryzae 70-15]